MASGPALRMSCPIPFLAIHTELGPQSDHRFTPGNMGII